MPNTRIKLMKAQKKGKIVAVEDRSVGVPNLGTNISFHKLPPVLTLMVSKVRLVPHAFAFVIAKSKLRNITCSFLLIVMLVLSASDAAKTSLFQDS